MEEQEKLKLTQQQENFASKYVECGNATAAYKFAYPKSEKWKESAVWSESSKMLSNTKVLQRVNELKQELANKNLWTREDSVKILAEIANYTYQNNTDRINALKELNRMHGYEGVKKVDLQSSDGSMSPKPLTLDDFYKDTMIKK